MEYVDIYQKNTLISRAFLVNVFIEVKHNLT
jgi:hypothetical protein